MAHLTTPVTSLPMTALSFSEAHYLQCDIAFRRIASYEELSWVVGTRPMVQVSQVYNSSWVRKNLVNYLGVCYCRIFLKCQSAQARFLVFQKIDEIVKHDTGYGLHWRHLHSQTLKEPLGIFLLGVDLHMGQALGEEHNTLSFYWYIYIYCN